jgi:glutathione S-transferase
MAEALMLYVCHVDRRGPAFHPCRRVQEALDKAGHRYEKVVFDRNRPAGLFTKGKRPELQELSGQEKLPVLRLPDGRTVNGSGAIVRWAKATAPGAA